MREYLLSLHHDGQNHFGYEKTYEMITRDYFWPGLDKDVKKYIKSCESCARNKTSTHAPRGLLHSMPIPGGRFVEIAMDFVGPIPKCKGYDTILSVTNRFTGYVRLITVHSMDTAQQIAETFYRCQRSVTVTLFTT